MNARKQEAYGYRRDPAVPVFPDERPIIVFDGYCALCTGWVEFVLRHDHKKIYRLLPAQSPLGTALYVHFGLGPHDYETNILIADGMAWFKSESSIRMLESLGFPWSLARCLRILPLPWRDRLYETVARNRLRWFGKRDVCYRTDESYADRFLA